MTRKGKKGMGLGLEHYMRDGGKKKKRGGGYKRGDFIQLAGVGEEIGFASGNDGTPEDAKLQAERDALALGKKHISMIPADLQREAQLVEDARKVGESSTFLHSLIVKNRANPALYSVELEKVLSSLGGAMIINEPDCTVVFPVHGPYVELMLALYDALNQAQTGKGHTRHDFIKDASFAHQPIGMIQSLVGPGYPLGQAIKKAYEASRFMVKGEWDHAKHEILGAIVCLASILVSHQEVK